MTHTHTHTHFLRYFVWGDFFFRSIQLCMYTQHTQTPFLKSKVAHTHSHMNDLRYTKSDTRMLVKQQTVTMRLAVIVAMLTHGVCVCLCTSHRVTFCHTEFKQASIHSHHQSTHTNCCASTSFIHSHIHTNEHSRKKPKRPTRFRIICDAMKFLVLINIKCCDFKSWTLTHYSLFNTSQTEEKLTRKNTLFFSYQMCVHRTSHRLYYRHDMYQV